LRLCWSLEWGGSGKHELVASTCAALRRVAKKDLTVAKLAKSFGDPTKVRRLELRWVSIYLPVAWGGELLQGPWEPACLYVGSVGDKLA